MEYKKYKVKKHNIADLIVLIKEFNEKLATNQFKVPGPLKLLMIGVLDDLYVKLEKLKISAIKKEQKASNPNIYLHLRYTEIAVISIAANNVSIPEIQSSITLILKDMPIEVINHLKNR